MQQDIFAQSMVISFHVAQDLSQMHILVTHCGDGKNIHTVVRRLDMEAPRFMVWDTLPGR